MFVKSNTLLSFTALALFASPNLHASEVEFSIGGGFPFFVVPQVSLTQQDKRYYVNYKAGLDDGFSAGMEWLNDNHAYGVFVGAVGAREASNDCEIQSLCDALRIIIFDEKTTQGIGLSYEYRFSGQDQSGWGLRLEAGYGQESRNKSERADANIQFSYHF